MRTLNEKAQDLISVNDAPSSKPVPADFSPHYSNIVFQLTGTLHKAELEYAAALIIKWHKYRNCHNWVGFSRTDIATLFKENSDPTLLEYGRNPFWEPDPMGLLEKGYIEGWDYGPENADMIGKLTDKFLDAVGFTWNKSNPAWTLGRRQSITTITKEE